MNRLFTYLLLVAAFVLIGCKASAQQFRTHAVQQGETLFSIAREYHVSVGDLLKYNKEVRQDQPLRPNTILVIPGQAPGQSDSTAVARRDSVDLSQPINFHTHRVRRKETLFSITRRYEISEDELKRYNSELYSRPLQKGMVLRIPQFAPGYREALELESQLSAYTVKPKETRWSIAHDFGITVDSLLALNPELPRNTSYLAVGQELQVPKLPGEDGPEQETELFVSYTVPAQKTLFSLSQEYGVPREEILRLNPEIVERGGLQQGMQLRLPEKKVDTMATAQSEFVFYEVKPRQTEYSLTRKLNMGWSELRTLNPDLAKGLKAGMVLKLPRKNAEGLEIKNTLVLDRFDLRDSINRQHVPQLLVLFPFRLDRLNLSDREATRERIRNNNALKYSLGLYSGLLVALDSISEMGISVEVKTMDTELNPARVRNLMMQEDLSRLSAILGPLDPRSVREVAAMASELDVPVIAPVPVAEDVPLENVFYSFTGEKQLRDKLLRFMAAQHADQNIIVISDSDNRAAEEAILEVFPAAELVPLREEEENISLDLEAFQLALVEERENWVFLETDNFKIASSVTSILNSSNTELTPIRMFTTDKGTAYDNDVISATHLSNLRFTFPSVYREAPSSAFTRRYRQRFGGEPDRYAVRGFDLGMDILLRLAYKLDLFLVADQIGVTQYSGNKFNYMKELQSGYYNTASYVLMYDGLRIKEVATP